MNVGKIHDIMLVSYSTSRQSRSQMKIIISGTQAPNRVWMPDIRVQIFDLVQTAVVTFYCSACHASDLLGKPPCHSVNFVANV